MTVIGCLKIYRRQLVDMGTTPEQRDAINNIFSNWFFAAPKVDADGILPARAVVFDGSHAALARTGFNTVAATAESARLYQRYLDTCAAHFAEDNDYEYVPDVITAAQLQRLKKLYTGPPGRFEAAKNKLVQLYQFVGVTNMHLSMPPIYTGIEMFGSPLNTHNKQFCSPFALEKRFGSLGSFWDYKFHKDGLYLCNPPFDDAVIARMATRLNTTLLTSRAVTVVITIPVWDSATQRQLKIKDYKLGFPGFDTLLASQHYRARAVLDKFQYPYYNYYTQKKAPAAHTHLVVLSSATARPFDMAKFMKRWRNWGRSDK